MLCAPPPQQTWQSIEIFEDKPWMISKRLKTSCSVFNFSVRLVLSKSEHVTSVVGFEETLVRKEPCQQSR